MSEAQDSTALELEAEELFLARVSQGPSSSAVEELCREHPEHAERFQRYQNAWSWAESQGSTDSSAEDDQPPPPPHSTDPGRYVVGDRLGAGGMSTGGMSTGGNLGGGGGECVTPGDPCDAPGVECCPDEQCLFDDVGMEFICVPM